MAENIPNGIRSYLFDLAKIVDGAANSDFDKVLAYGDQLANRLIQDGEPQGAKRLREILSRSKARRLSLAHGLAPSAPPAIPVDSESRLSVADEEHWQSGQVSLFLSEAQRSEVDRFLACTRAANKLISSGVGYSGSLLLHGPPGCGKTQIARYVAAELGIPILTARTDALISSFLGSTAKNIRQLFDHAASRRCILFLDEFDALAKMRDDSNELGELKRVVISLLQNIDALGPDHLLIAATNHEHLLDPAVWRRFGYKLHITEPDEVCRIEMLKSFLGSYANQSQILLAATLSQGMSGAAMKAIADDAIRAAVLSDSTNIESKFILDRMLATRGGGTRQHTRDEKIILARQLNPKRFTQQMLAELFGVSQSHVSKVLARGVVRNG